MQLEAHVFICTHTRTDKASCGAKGSEGLRDEVKAEARKSFAGNKIRINASGCLGHCEEGIACVIYPQQKWLLGLNSGDAQTVCKSLDEALKG